MMKFGVRKIESWGYQAAQYRRVTDGQTNRQTRRAGKKKKKKLKHNVSVHLVRPKSKIREGRQMEPERLRRKVHFYSQPVQKIEKKNSKRLRLNNKQTEHEKKKGWLVVRALVMCDALINFKPVQRSEDGYVS